MNMAIDFEEKQLSLNDYRHIFLRRRKLFAITAVAVVVIALLTALLWPAKYRSSATILIEEQEIPQDLVRSTITSYANQQIKVITQRTMTLSNILDIVRRFDLLSEEELKRTPRTEVMEDFQRDMGLELVSAEVMDPRIGRPMEATIAFKLSFDHRNPEIARKVANELVNLYLNENLKTRTEKTATTAQFLQNEADTLNHRIADLEQQLADFKQKNEGALPELYQYNLNVIERTDAELQSARVRMSELAKRRLELQANLAQLTPYAPTALPNGEMVLSDQDRLRSLESELRSKESLYNENHPDIRRLRREVAELKQQFGDAADGDQQLRRLAAERDKLAQLQRNYSADHPAVKSQQRLVDTLARGQPGPATAAARADNPAYVMLDTQIRSIDAELTMLEHQRADLQSKLARFEGYLAKAPDVERDYQELVRQLATSTAKYQEIAAKQMQADLAKNLETERKGERYLLIEPPIRPDEPVSPNRAAILLIGVVLAALSGLAAIAIAEALDEGISGEKDLVRILGAAPLASIPLFTLDLQQPRIDRRKWIYAGTGAALIAVLLTTIHLAYKPLDVLWFVLLRKLGL